jgi:hypothetical protein
LIIITPHCEVTYGFTEKADKEGYAGNYCLPNKRKRGFSRTNNVMRADASHKGMGILGDRNYDNIDGLVTNEPGLCQFYICIRQGD